MGLSLRKLGKQIFAQANPFDNGRTFNNQRPTNNRSVFGQAVHNNPVIGAARQVINPVGSGLQQAARIIPTVPSNNPMRFLNNAVINPVKTTDIHAGQALQGRNPYHGTVGQQVGQFGQDVINASSVLSFGKGAQIALKGAPVVSKIAQGAKFGVKVGGGYGAAQGVSTSLKDQLSLKDAAKTIGVNTAMGAGGGLALGVAGPLAGSAPRAIVPVSKAAKDVVMKTAERVSPKLTQLDQSGKVQLPKIFGRSPENQSFHYTAPTNGYTKVSGKASDVRTKLKLGEGGYVKLPGKPEVTAKAPEVAPVAGVDQKLEEAILGPQRDVNFKSRPITTLTEKFSPNKLVRQGTRALESGVNATVRASEESGSRLARAPGRLAVGISKQAGKTPEELARLTEYQGQREVGDIYGKQVAQMGDKAIQQGVRKEAIAAHLDPELHKATGGKPFTLTPQEQSEADRLRKVLDLTHEGNHKLGLIDEATYKANKGNYTPRDFTKAFETNIKGNKIKDGQLELNIFKHRTDLSKIDQKVLDKASKDPYFMTAVRVQQYQKNKAFSDYSNWLAKNGSIADGPRPGYIQVPDSPAYGSLQGKHILKEQLEDLQGFIYETDAGQHAMGLLNAYDRFAPRRWRKSILTIYNPGVRLGNRTFNYLVTSLNGINPVTFTKNYYKGRNLIKSNSPEYLEATRQGVFGSSIIDKELYRGNELTRGKSIPSKVHNKAADTYQAVDNEAKMGAYITFRERGLAPAEAAARTKRILQDYDLVGHLFDTGAKTPIIGNAFVRFSSELMRIAHNTAVDNPIRAGGAAVAASSLITLASKLSGENPEDRKTREGRLGAARVPFTHQSLEVQTPWGAINTGRLLGLTTYNDLSSGMANDASRLIPWQNPVKHDKTGFHVDPQGVTADPLVGPLVSQAINRDFRGKPITDPDQAKYPNQPLSKDQQNKNRLNKLRMDYQPYATEGNSLKAAKESKKNYYGSERTLPQALLRTGGVKVEKFGKKQAEAQRGRDEYFSGEFAQAEDWKRKNPELAGLYDKFKGREKVRSGPNKDTKFFDLVTPEKWKIVSGDQSGKLYDRLKQEAMTAQKKGEPFDPVYGLEDKTKVKEVLDIRSAPPGNLIEREEILRATSNWYKQFEKAEGAYYDSSGKFFGGKGLKDTRGPRAKEWANIPHPEQPALVQRYYSIKGKNTQAGKDFYKANADALSKAFSGYKSARLSEINAKRKIMGFQPISQDTYNNVTFGYEDDERKVFNELKYGKGYGGGYGYSGGGGRPKSVGSAYKYAVSLNAGGKARKPQISVSKGKKAVAYKSAKPKVSSKKSLV